MTDLILLPTPLLIGDMWQLSVTRHDPQAVAMYERHYSCKRRGGRQFGGPGYYVGLMTLRRDALFLWIAERFRCDGQTGINCSVFRNESSLLSSALIEEACVIAWRRWPGERLYTFISSDKIRSVNPGYCFKKSGFKQCGKSKSGLLIFERLP